MITPIANRAKEVNNSSSMWQMSIVLETVTRYQQKRESF
jgi:hypothetical protein